MNRKELEEFEQDIAREYEGGKIRSPIHLSGGNELHLIEIFKNIKEDDWVFSTHRNHYHALLKSKDPKWVKREIMNGRSMHIASRKYKFFTSSIVGGVLPIALGVALAIKRKKKQEHVWCFVGDMAAETGIFHECERYAIGHRLPITFIVENNHFSVYTPTNKVWGSNTIYETKKRIYRYNRKWPHYGIGRFVDF